MSTNKSKIIFPLLLTLTAMMVLLVTGPVQGEATDVYATDRTGAWVDTIHISANPSSQNVFDQMIAGTLDIHTQDITGSPALYAQAQSNPNVAAELSPSGNYHELSFNPAGPVFSGTGQLNPFAVREIRAAMNRLIDRSHLVNTAYGGLAIPRTSMLAPARPEYVRYFSLMQTIETEYAYSFQAANTTITAQMNALGAARVGNTWHFNGEPVTLIFLIRNDDMRLTVGNYVADQLESLGFAVDRQYVNAAQAGPIWLNSNPNDGLWHIYTGGWVSPQIATNQEGDFQFFYTPNGVPAPLWQAYTPVPALQNAADSLANRTYATLAERDNLMETAVTLSMQDSVRIWLADLQGFTLRRTDVTAAHNLLGGLPNSDLWPYTLRFVEAEGGVINMSHPNFLLSPWNPQAGSNFVYDATTMRALEDRGLISHPVNGLNLPQRIESATVTAQSGLTIRQTYDWVTLGFAPTVEVPGDAWVDWDATSQTWITADEKFGTTQTANIKSVVVYPDDLFDTITWHDGSPLSPADFVMAMILRFDIANPDSNIYDPSMVAGHNAFMSQFKGFRITSTDPLIIEYYTNQWDLDVEKNVYPLWPVYGRSEAPWHTMAVGYMADWGGFLAFSSAKANANAIPWMNYLGGAGFTTLADYVAFGQSQNFVPYSPTLLNFMTTADATARWSSLQDWLADHNHLWLGTGPFYLDTVSLDDKTMTLQRNPDFPDPSDRWEGFDADPSPAALTINFSSGAPGSFFNITGTGYPANRTATISVNGVALGTALTGTDGSFSATLQTSPDSSAGTYFVTVSVNPSAITQYQLDPDAPLRAQEGELPSYSVPEDVPAITDLVFLPLIMR